MVRVEANRRNRKVELSVKVEGDDESCKYELSSAVVALFESAKKMGDESYQMLLNVLLAYLEDDVSIIDITKKEGAVS